MQTTRSIYRGFCFPPEVIAHAVFLYHRFPLSLRDVEDLLAQRGIAVSYETDVLQLSKSCKRAIGRVGLAPSHAATSNKLLMN